MLVIKKNEWDVLLRKIFNQDISTKKVTRSNGSKYTAWNVSNVGNIDNVSNVGNIDNVKMLVI